MIQMNSGVIFPYFSDHRSPEVSLQHCLQQSKGTKNLCVSTSVGHRQWKWVLYFSLFFGWGGKNANKSCTFSSNGCVEGIVQRLKTYRDQEICHEVKVKLLIISFCAAWKHGKAWIVFCWFFAFFFQFFDMRILFLLTALCADIR